MRQKESKAAPLQIQLERPRVRIAISPHHSQRHSQTFECHERFRIADIAQMPDLVGSNQPLWKARRVEIVSVRDDGDTHEGREVGLPVRSLDVSDLAIQRRGSRAMK